jgi:hypothetical protein
MFVGDYSKHDMNREAVTFKLRILFIENPTIYHDLNTNVLIAVIIRTYTSVIVLRNFT